MATVRRVVRNQLYIACLAMLAGLGLAWLGNWAPAFALGTLLITWNFYFIAKFAQQAIFFRYSRKVLFKLLFSFYGRLIITGLVLAVLILKLQVPSVALLAGLSTVVASITVWGLALVLGEQKVKEA